MSHSEIYPSDVDIIDYDILSIYGQLSIILRIFFKKKLFSNM